MYVGIGLVAITLLAVAMLTPPVHDAMIDGLVSLDRASQRWKQQQAARQAESIRRIQEKADNGLWYDPEGYSPCPGKVGKAICLVIVVVTLNCIRQIQECVDKIFEVKNPAPVVVPITTSTPCPPLAEECWETYIGPLPPTATTTPATSTSTSTQPPPPPVITPAPSRQRPHIPY